MPESAADRARALPIRHQSRTGGPGHTERVLRDVDVSVAAWLTTLLPPGVGVVFDAPGIYDGTKPALALYLYAVQEEPDGGAAGWSELRGGDGQVIGRLPPDRRYRLTYLMTAWSVDTLGEHELLGQVLAGAAVAQVLPPQFRAGRLVAEERPVLLFCAPERSTVDPRELWAAWRIPPRTALELTVLAPLPREMLTGLIGAPTEIDLRSESRVPVPVATNGRAEQPPLRRHRARIEEG